MKVLNILTLLVLSVITFTQAVETDEFFVEKLTEGNGEVPPKGVMVTVHYTGKLTDGSVFDSSVQRGDPFRFKLGAGQVIKCWDEGISQLEKGQKAVLHCPYQMAYGERGYPPVIPAKAKLIFEVELLDFAGSKSNDL